MSEPIKMSYDSSIPSDGNGFFSNKNAFIIILLVLLIIFMIGISGIFNILNLLMSTIQGVLSSIGFTTGNILKNSADIIADTADVGIDIAKGATHSIGDLLINSTNQEIDYSKQVSLREVIGIPKLEFKQTDTPQPVQTSEPTVTPISTQKPKAGWCYIGNFEGVKGCMKVSEHDKCVSGQIFPSKEECFRVTHQ